MKNNITFKQFLLTYNFRYVLDSSEEGMDTTIIRIYPPSIEDNLTNDNLSLSYDYEKEYIEKDKTAAIFVRLEYKKQLLNVDEISLNNLNGKFFSFSFISSFVPVFSFIIGNCLYINSYKS